MNEQQIEKAFQIIASPMSDKVRRNGNREKEFCFYSVPRSIVDMVPDRPFADEDMLLIDFGFRLCTFMSCCISHHNGDSYGNYSYQLPFETVLLLEPVLMNLLVQNEEKQLKVEEEISRKAVLTARVLERLK